MKWYGNQREKKSVVSYSKKNSEEDILWVVLRKGISVYSYQRVGSLDISVEYMSVSK